MKNRFLATYWCLIFIPIGLSPVLAVPISDPSSFLAADHSAPALDDAPKPFVPEHGKSEADADRVEALSLFTAGRRHEQREEYADALRCYERALRCDPESSVIVQAILPVALRLKRHDEAARYALLAGKLGDADPLQLRQLGVCLTEQGDYVRAATLYEKSLTASNKPTLDIVLWKELGDLCVATGRHKRAAECFAKLLDAVDHPEKFGLDEQLKTILFPNGGQSYQAIGECFLAADRPEDAKAAFEKAEKLAPNKAMRQFNLARVYLKTKKPTEAIAAIESAFAEHIADEGMAPYETLAQVLQQLGKSGELIARLEKLRAADPKSAPLGFFLASQYRTAGKLDKAESLYVELLKTNPTIDGYRELLDVHRRTKRFDAMLETQGEAVEKLGLMKALWAESLTAAENEELTRGILGAARNKLKSAPDKFTCGMRVAAALRALQVNQFDAVSEFLALAIAAKPKQPDEVFMVWGLALLTGNRAAEAVKVFQRAIDEKAALADNPIFHFYLAGALELAGRTDDALAAAKTAADKKKDSARFYGRPAWVLYFAKRNDDAMKAYRELIEKFDADRHSDEDREVMHEARLALSNLCALKGETTQAEEWLEQVLDEFPDDKGAMNDLGYLWADANKNLGRARRMIQAAVDAEPNNMAYRDSLGWVLFRQGKYAEAVVELEKAANDKSPDGTVLDHLGDAYQKAGHRDKALEAWRKALDLLRKDKDEKKASLVESKITGK
jgi:tetratricopeptide (TPR) repeat protein